MRQRSHTPSDFPPYGEIQIGEPDANAEYFAALRKDEAPIFLNSFLALPHFPEKSFLCGEKYIIYGQKGTGKTSVLRYLESCSRKQYATEFLIFRKSFLQDIDIQDFAKTPLLVDEDEIKRFKHFHHAIKRLLVLLCISKTLGAREEVTENEVNDHVLRNLIKSVADSTVGDVIRFGLDSIASIFSSLKIDLRKSTDEKLLIEGGRLIKRGNDDLLKFFIRKAKAEKQCIRIYLDEIHFAYRTEDSLQQDAILVRDTILATQALNDRFAEEKLDVIIYLAVRSEYLDHPIIATADINHAVESVGFDLIWSHFPMNKSHPLFDIAFKRFKDGMDRALSRNQFFSVYMTNTDPRLFLERTWSKPRDFIRFFKCAKTMYPHRSRLNLDQSNAVWRLYAQESWKEIKSSASPFLPPTALAHFEEVFSKIVPNIFDGSVKYNVRSFGKLFERTYRLAKGNLDNFYSFDHFMRLLYTLGIFSTRRRDAREQDIFHSYHRGNRNYHANGEVIVHPAVLKAFG